MRLLYYYKIRGICTMKRFDVVALGELLIDFTQNGLSGQGNMIMEANPGGAPCNVLAMLQKLARRQHLWERLEMTSLERCFPGL